MVKNKGSKYEREVCKQLSLWWTGGERDDVFWRSTTSGARATIRSKQGKVTFGQYGDIQATDPIGQPLLNVCTIEVKRGYTKDHFHDMIDSPSNELPKQYEKFIEQVKADSEKADSIYWLLIVKRDRKLPMVYMPIKFYKHLIIVGAFENVKFTHAIKIKKYNKVYFGCRLEEFWQIDPRYIEIMDKYNEEK